MVKTSNHYFFKNFQQSFGAQKTIILMLKKSFLAPNNLLGFFSFLYNVFFKISFNIPFSVWKDSNSNV